MTAKRKPPELPQGRQRFILAKPPKPVNQMTPEERRAWAEVIADALMKQQPSRSGESSS
jgi:hypothetical protein